MACNGNSMTPGNHMCNKRCWLRSRGSCTDGTRISLPQTPGTQAEPSIISSPPPSHLIRARKRHDWLCVNRAEFHVISGVENGTPEMMDTIHMMSFQTPGIDWIKVGNSVKGCSDRARAADVIRPRENRLSATSDGKISQIPHV